MNSGADPNKTDHYTVPLHTHEHTTTLLTPKPAALQIVSGKQQSQHPKATKLEELALDMVDSRHLDALADPDIHR